MTPQEPRGGEVVREWLDMAVRQPIDACHVLRHPPISPGELAAIRDLLDRSAPSASGSGDGKPELTSAKEVHDLIQGDDPVIRAAVHANVYGGNLINFAYALIADRKDRRSSNPPAVVGEALSPNPVDGRMRADVVVNQAVVGGWPDRSVLTQVRVWMDEWLKNPEDNWGDKIAWESALEIAHRVDAVERTEADAISAAIGTVEFMDPPDGGAVSLAEQVRRMKTALDEARAALFPPVGEWRGIETLPHGERVLADVRYSPPHTYYGSQRVEIGTMDGVGWAGEGIRGEPVMWMPFPAPPLTTDKGEGE